MGGEASGCGVGDAGGDYKASHVTCLLCGLEDGTAGGAVREDGDGTIVGFEAAGEGGGSGSGVGY